MEKTKKERIYDMFSTYKENEVIDAINMAKTSEATMAYINSTMKYALELDFLKFHDSGNYMLGVLPPWKVYKKKMTEASETYRRSLPSYGGSVKRPRKSVPKTFNFEASETTIVAIIQKLVTDNKEAKNQLAEMKVKYNKALKFAKKLKQQRDEFEAAFSDIGVD